MLNKKIDSYIVFSKLSKEISLSLSIIESLRKKRVQLIIIANDVGESQKKKFLDKANYYNVPYIFYETKAYLGMLLNKSAVSAIGIENTNLAKAILNQKEGDYNGKKEDK